MSSSNLGVPPRNDSASDDYPVLYNEGSEELKYVKTGVKNTINTGGSSYLVYTALIAQNNAEDPIATVLENTLGGTVVWTRNFMGSYSGTLEGAFPNTRTIMSPFSANFNNNYQVVPVTDFNSSGISGFYTLSAGNDSILLDCFDATMSHIELDTLMGGSSAQLVIDCKVYPA